MSTNRKKKCQKSSMIHKSIVYIQCDKWLQYHNLSNACFKGFFLSDNQTSFLHQLERKYKLHLNILLLCWSRLDLFQHKREEPEFFLLGKKIDFNKWNILLQFARLWLHQQHAIKQTILWFQPFILYSLGYQMLNWCLICN